jgi:hypothetical protein
VAARADLNFPSCPHSSPQEASATLCNVFASKLKVVASARVADRIAAAINARSRSPLLSLFWRMSNALKRAFYLCEWRKRIVTLLSRDRVGRFYGLCCSSYGSPLGVWDF